MSAFVSEIEGFVNHTFDYGQASNAAQFKKTREEFGLWCQRKFDDGSNDVYWPINDMHSLRINVPDLTDSEERKKLMLDMVVGTPSIMGSHRVGTPISKFLADTFRVTNRTHTRQL